LQARELGPATQAQERANGRLFANRGVAATAVGLTERGRPAVKAYVTRDYVGGLPRDVEGFPVILVRTGSFMALQEAQKKCPSPPCNGGGGGGGGGGNVDPKSRFDRPVPIGVSTGHPDITACTIGARVTDGSNVYALSNNHCYADENLASNGDNVLQPGPLDGGQDPADAIGTLDDFEPIVFSTSANNTIDAAIALSSAANLGNATPSNGYGTPKSATIAPAVGMKVKKYGRTTGQTAGRIDAINAAVNVGYSSGTARFVGQIVLCCGLSQGGDSGSLFVVDGGKGRNKQDDRKTVGLLFAGNTTYTIANPIDAVLTRFGVTIDGE
jgi:hypothetical protein